MNYSNGEIETWKNYIAAEGRFTPVGGETCEVSSFSTCSKALVELARQRYTYLHHDYHPEVVAAWKSSGCFDEISRRLGYRLSLREVQFPEVVQAGGELTVRITLENVGFASLLNLRPVFLVLDKANGERLELEVTGADPRRWEAGVTTFDAAVRIPAGASVGRYRLSLWLPDASAGLRVRPDYAVQLANSGTWDAATGLNVLTTDVELN